MSEICGIILAAGSSRRMGMQKMLLPYGRSTILETTITHVLGSNVDRIVVVLGADRDRILEVISPLPVEHCNNENHLEGMLSSVICGLNAVPPECGAAMIFPGDQPEISPGVINNLIDFYNQSLKGIVIPVYENRRGHPLLVDMKYRRIIEQLDPSRGLRALMHIFPEDIGEVEVGEPGILVDIDNRDAYEAAIKKHSTVRQ
jgi:molybdenum cofactor cytidylyltransferase